MAKVIISTGPLFTFCTERIGSMLFLHFECKQWSVGLYKLYKKMFNIFLNESRKTGIDKVYVAIPDTDAKLLRFERMFGFEVVFKSPGILILERTTEV